MTTNLEPAAPAPKAAIQSVTVWGAITGLLGLLLPPLLIKLHVAPADAADAATYAGQIIGAIGGLVAIYGRTRSDTALPPINSIVNQKG